MQASPYNLRRYMGYTGSRAIMPKAKFAASHQNAKHGAFSQDAAKSFGDNKFIKFIKGNSIGVGAIALLSAAAELMDVNFSDYDKKREAVAEYFKACYDCLQAKHLPNEKRGEVRENLIKSTMNLQFYFNFKKNRERLYTLAEVSSLTQGLLLLTNNVVSPLNERVSVGTEYEKMCRVKNRLSAMLWEYEPQPFRRWFKKIEKWFASFSNSSDRYEQPAIRNSIPDYTKTLPLPLGFYY